MNFIHDLKGLRIIPYTLRAYANGLEQILEPVIQKMRFIENRIKNTGKIYNLLPIPYFRNTS